MTFVRMSVKGVLLLAASTILFSGMIAFAEAVGLDLFPRLMFEGDAMPLAVKLGAALAQIAIGVGIGIVYKKVKTRWDRDAR